MSLARHIATEARLRTELNEALRERNTARGERDAARNVVAAQADALRERDGRIAYLTGERDELDAAHRAALADLAEVHRMQDAAARPMRDQPDMDRCG
ncbi:hypothetical protein SEA_PHELPSODU_48 [Mycobacterium phage PhelpsODU]|uniref:Uncharacterized protein n=1 Tax=Mycobacterium phage Unicorn TaxID=2015825 RepID=A0A222ZL23_9CAUD|nr:hypothetical protein I5G78_gp058 [Mycobacterium phage Unicorn]ASR85059.1 hypothetical protein SEA_UNICORN_48 [Mycobacterium phage Unicorn]ASR85159.1 hypothetical protein SEA_PHELPSODU_48 [Mycobacterium phage PhelpsODU]